MDLTCVYKPLYSLRDFEEQIYASEDPGLYGRCTTSSARLYKMWQKRDNPIGDGSKSHICLFTGLRLKYRRPLFFIFFLLACLWYLIFAIRRWPQWFFTRDLRPKSVSTCGRYPRLDGSCLARPWKIYYYAKAFLARARTSQITLRLFFFSVDDNNPERLVGVEGGGGYMCRQLTDSAGRSLAKGEDGLNGKEEMSDAHPTFKENMRIIFGENETKWLPCIRLRYV